MGDWQPISTAPKDGAAILSWGDNTYGVIVYCPCKGEWALAEEDGNKPHSGRPIKWIFTHWMPLPPPPAGEDA